jgi:hypothetical protein
LDCTAFICLLLFCICHSDFISFTFTVILCYPNIVLFNVNSIINIERNHSIVYIGSNNSITKVGYLHSIVNLGANYSIVNIGSNHSIVNTGYITGIAYFKLVLYSTVKPALKGTSI